MIVKHCNNCFPHIEIKKNELEKLPLFYVELFKIYGGKKGFNSYGGWY